MELDFRDDQIELPLGANDPFAFEQFRRDVRAREIQLRTFPSVSRAVIRRFVR